MGNLNTVHTNYSTWNRRKAKHLDGLLWVMSGLGTITRNGKIKIKKLELLTRENNNIVMLAGTITIRGG